MATRPVDHHPPAAAQPAPGHHHDCDHAGAHHQHSYLDLAGSDAAWRALMIALWIQVVFLVVQVAGGIIYGSLALLSDSVHMLTDVAAIAIALVAIRAARSAARRFSYGLRRAEVLAAFVNSLALVGAAAWIVWEAIRRMGHGHEVDGIGMLVIATLGLAANLVSAWILARAGSGTNVRAVMMHLLIDAASSVGVIVTAIVIATTGRHGLDSIASLLIAGLALWGALPLIRRTMEILLDVEPDAARVPDIADALLAHPAVVEVHDLHAWHQSEQEVMVTAHVVHLPDASTAAVIASLEELLQTRFGITHSTLQAVPAASLHAPLPAMAPDDAAAWAISRLVAGGVAPAIAHQRAHAVAATLAAGARSGLVSPAAVLARARAAGTPRSPGPAVHHPH